MRYKTLDEKSARLQVKRRSIKPVDPLFTAHHFFNIPRNNSLKYFTPPPREPHIAIIVIKIIRRKIRVIKEMAGLIFDL